jgi:hypothetical protein
LIAVQLDGLVSGNDVLEKDVLVMEIYVPALGQKMIAIQLGFLVSEKDVFVVGIDESALGPELILFLHNLVLAREQNAIVVEADLLNVDEPDLDVAAVTPQGLLQLPDTLINHVMSVLIEQISLLSPEFPWSFDLLSGGLHQVASERLGFDVPAFGHLLLPAE